MGKSIGSSSFSWELADYFIDYLTPILTTDCTNSAIQNIFFGGSYIRKAKICNDLDIAILRPEIDQHKSIDLIIQDLVSDHNGHFLAKGSKVQRMVLWLADSKGVSIPVQVDIWLRDKLGDWGPTCMFVAGSGKLNIIQRSRAAKQGYTLGFGIVEKATKQYHPSGSEKDTYDFFGWDWLDYPNRSL